MLKSPTEAISLLTAVVLGVQMMTVALAISRVSLSIVCVTGVEIFEAVVSIKRNYRHKTVHATKSCRNVFFFFTVQVLFLNLNPRLLQNRSESRVRMCCVEVDRVG